MLNYKTECCSQSEWMSSWEDQVCEEEIQYINTREGVRLGVMNINIYREKENRRDKQHKIYSL